MAASSVQSAVAAQLGAGLDMLENAIRACPDSLWGDASRSPQFWYIAYHVIFYVDVYLSKGDQGFAPPPPYTLSEFDPLGPMPDRVYSKEEMLSYLEHDRRKFRGVVAEWTDERAREELKFGSITGSRLEVMIYNLRHIQHHAAQLNLILRQVTDSAPKWVVRGIR